VQAFIFCTLKQKVYKFIKKSASAYLIKQQGREADMGQIAVLLLAIAFHGGGHILTARLCGMRMRRVCRSATGLRLITARAAFPSYAVEALVALGGPLGNLVGNAVLYLAAMLTHCAFLRSLCSSVMPVSLFLAAWNLLPIEGFDGGRILRCLLLQRGASLRASDRVLAFCSAFFFCLFWMLSMYLLLRTGRAFSLFWFCVQLFWGCWRREGEGFR
jgi:Zn-dependent protease